MENIFEQLQDDTKSFWAPSAGVRRLDGMPSPSLFFRDYVATSTPLIIAGGASSLLKDTPRSWDDLRSLAAPGLEVTVDFTPDGRGDSIVRGGLAGSAVFVKPEERRMKFEAFVELLLSGGNGEGEGGPSSSPSSSNSGEVPYLSHQNDSLRQEFPSLMADVEPFLELAREAFGNEPDAVNLWIGDERSMSAVHKDHYENMYCVVRGEKHFTLLPPSDVLFLYEQEYPQGRYRRKPDGTGFEVDMEEETLSWIPVDPACPDLEKYPLFRHASPVNCCVGAGDILYLPALWYHRVSQKGPTVAVNYWHDMQFDHKYVYFRFLQGLARKIRVERRLVLPDDTSAEAPLNAATRAKLAAED